MIDIHCHIIFGVDDGPSSIKESIRMILEAEKLGVKDIIATPHFNEYLFDMERVTGNFQEIVSRTKDCGVNLHLGHEVFISSLLPCAGYVKSRLTMSGSRYLLFELPFNNIPPYAAETVFKMHAENIIPIIAHPERNINFVRHFDTFLEFIENGCLLQLDAASIIGVYGPEVKRFTQKLIKSQLPHFVASDAHCAEDYTSRYLAAYSQVKHWGGEEYARKLFVQNPAMLLSSVP